MRTSAHLAATALFTALVIFQIARPAIAVTKDEVAQSLVHLRVDATRTDGSPLAGTATGFLVTADGQVLTAYHLLRGLEPYVPETLVLTARVGQKGPPFDVSVAVISALPDLDLLLLKLSEGPTPYKPVRLGSSRTSPVDTHIQTFGFPANLPGIWSGDGKIRSTEGPGGSVWGTDMSFTAGQSGSPIFLDNGDVIGVVKGTLKDAPSINFFTPIDFADQLLIPLRLAEIEKRINAIPVQQCRVCFATVSGGGGQICAGSLKGCSDWSDGTAAGETAVAGWTQDLQIVPGATGFSCSMRWKVECQPKQ